MLLDLIILDNILELVDLISGCSQLSNSGFFFGNAGCRLSTHVQPHPQPIQMGQGAGATGPDLEGQGMSRGHQHAPRWRLGSD